MFKIVKCKHVYGTWRTGYFDRHQIKECTECGKARRRKIMTKAEIAAYGMTGAILLMMAFTVLFGRDN